MKIHIDKTSKIPIYYQIQEQVREAIRLGHLKPGDPVPDEESLASELGISRMTARHALTELAHEGFIRRERGRGSFVEKVRSLKVATPFRLMSYSEMFGANKVTSSVLSRGIEPAGNGTAKELGLSQGQVVVRIRRVRFVEGEPMSLEICAYPFDRLGALAETDLTDRSTYKILEEQFGIRPIEAKEVIELSVATSYEAELLKIPAGAPVFVSHRTSYDSDKRPIEYTKAVTRGDKFRFVTHLTRDDLIH